MPSAGSHDRPGLGEKELLRCGRERMPVRRSAISAALVIGAVAADGERLTASRSTSSSRRSPPSPSPRSRSSATSSRAARTTEAGALYVGLTWLALVLLVIGAAVHANTIDGRSGPRARRLDGHGGAGAARSSARRLDFVARVSCPSGEGATQPHPGRVKPRAWKVWRGSSSAAGSSSWGSGPADDLRRVLGCEGLESLVRVVLDPRLLGVRGESADAEDVRQRRAVPARRGHHRAGP